MKIYTCSGCGFVMGKEHGPGVMKILTSIGPEIRCGKCGNRVTERIVHGDEKKKLWELWEATKGTPTAGAA